MAKKSSSNIASQLAGQPIRIQLAILVGVLVLFAFLYWQFFYSSMSEEKSGIEANFSKLQQDHETLKKREVEYEELKKRKDETDRMLKKGRQSLPETADLASFIGNLQRQAAAAGIRFNNLKRLPETNETTFVRVPVEVEVQGNYFQLMKYMKLLHETKRIITVENIGFRSDTRESSDQTLTARFIATTFRQPDGAVRRVDDEIELDPKQESLATKAQAARDLRQSDLDKSAGIDSDSPEAGTQPEGGEERSASGLDRLKNSGAGAEK